MGDYKRDSEQDNSMDCPIWGTDDISDEELLKELEAVKNMTVPLPIPSPSSDEFEKIWATIQEERAESKNVPESNQPEHPKVIRPRFGWKRLAAIGLIACLVAGSGCMVAMGTKSYFYRGRIDSKDGAVFNNDSNKEAINGEEDAYKLIESELDIHSLKLSYIPEDMIFSNLEIGEGYADMRFDYNGNGIFLIQSKYKKEVSLNYKSNTQADQIVHNKWLNLDITIRSEQLDSEDVRYQTMFVYKGVYCRLMGIMSLDEFIKIVERLTY